MAKIIGIDLGTTNSCVAVIEGGAGLIIPNTEGVRTTPSVVALSKDGEWLVGAAAKRQAVANPARTVTSVKREMGSLHRVSIDGRDYSPEEVSAMILQRLKSDAEAYLGEPVTQAVITVPAYFTDAQRKATKDAGTIAGLKVERILNEPTAAALAYGMHRQADQTIMVYDLGGGTFDVSVLSISDGLTQVLATAGNNRLGGDDFDLCLAGFLAQQFTRQTGCEIKDDIQAMARLREAAETAKIELSRLTETTITLPFLASGKKGPCHLQYTLTREEFERLTAHLVEATVGPTKQVLEDAGIGCERLSKVLLVGGSTHMPAVRRMVAQLTGKEPHPGINPEECVAIGAALQAGMLSGELRGMLLLDVSPLSLGVETADGFFSRMIDRNTVLPIRKSQVYTTAKNYQDSVEIRVYQGEHRLCRENKWLGNFQLRGLRPALRGSTLIEVSFEMDANGIVHITAKDQLSGQEQDMTVTGSVNMSREDIERSVRHAKAFAELDCRRRADARPTADPQALLRRAEGLLAHMSKAARRRTEGAMRRVRQAQRRQDEALLRQACLTLECLCAPFVEGPVEQPTQE
ncbi:MAG: molecular chaperone DnaK [Eubacteriales bacterium]